MNSYLVSYDLIAPHKDYSALINAIKNYGTYAKVLESCWLIKSSSDATSIRNNLQTYVDSNDKLFVCNLTGECAWYNLSSEISKWIHDNL